MEAVQLSASTSKSLSKANRAEKIDDHHRHKESGVLSFSSARVHPMATSHNNGQVWAQRRDMATNAHGSGGRNHTDSMTSDPNGSTLTCESIGSCDPAMTAHHRPDWESPQRGGAATPSEVEANTDVHLDMPRLETNQSSVTHKKGSSKRTGSGEYTRLCRSAPLNRLEHPTERSLFLSFIGSICFLIASLVLFCPSLVILILVLPVSILVKRCMACCCCCTTNQTCACCCSKMMNPRDVVWLHDSPFNKMVVQSLITLQNGLDIARIRDLLNSRLVCAETKGGDRLFPRFSQKLTPVYSGYAWVNDAQFSINNHIYSMPKTIRNQDELEDYIGELAGRGLPKDRPLWEMQVLTDYGPEQDTVLLLRTHSCIGDGISLIRILYKSLVDNQTPFSPKPRFARGAYIFNIIRAIVVGPLVVLQRWIFSSQDHNVLHGPTLSGNKVVAWSEAFSMDSAMRIKQVTRSALNDVLLTVVAGNLRAYLQKCGISNPFDIKASIPIDFQLDGNSNKLSTRHTVVNFDLPTNTEGAIPQLWDVKHRMDELKNSADPVIIHGSHWVLANLLPQKLFSCLWSRMMNKATCIISNLQGPEGILLFASREVKNIMYWMPPHQDVSLSISFLSYADQLRMTVIADKAVLPDPHFITRDFIAQMEKLSLLLANRRIPGEHHSRHVDLSSHDDGMGGSEPSMEEIKVKMTEVQHQLQDLKSRLDTDSPEEYSHEERALMNRVEELKEEFKELLSELRRKKAGEGSVMSDDDEDEDGEIRRAYRKRSVSSTSRRSLVSISASTTRSLNTSPPSSQHTSSPPLVRAHAGSQHGSHVSTPSSPSMPVSHAPHRKYHTFHHTPTSRMHMSSATFTEDESSTADTALSQQQSTPKSDQLPSKAENDIANSVETCDSSTTDTNVFTEDKDKKLAFSHDQHKKTADGSYSPVVERKT